MQLQVIGSRCIFFRCAEIQLQLMKENCMVKLQILSVLLVLGTCLSTFPYTFSAGANSISQQPSYPLGLINQNSVLTILVQMPNGGSTSSLTLSVMDSTNTNTISSLGPCSGTSCTVSWTAVASASYYLKVAANTAQESSSLTMFYAFGTVDNRAVLRVADVLRQHIVKFFYVSQTAQATFTLYPFTDAASSYLTLVAMSASSTAINPTYASTSQPSPSTTTNGIATYRTSLAKGYYAIIVTLPSTATSAKITTQSDTYPCPYSDSFGDVYTVFTGCSTQSKGSNSGPPCANYNYAAQVCDSCMPGFTLVQGSCASSTNCPSRQYYHFGQCYDVSPTCDQFDPFTGDCLNCTSSTSLVSGKCIIQNCTDGSSLINGICVSNTCGTYNNITGVCYTCVTSAYFLSSGQCLPISCGTNTYYSVKSSMCINIPNQCSNFSITYEICYGCANGSYLSQGVCLSGNSQNCQIFNGNSNTCITCNNGYFLQNGFCTTTPICGGGQSLVNGICILNPSSCNSNQKLIGSQCVDIPDNCLDINNYHWCINCAPNYQIVSGVCQRCIGSSPNFPCLTCPYGSFPNSAGQCQQVSSSCAAYNNANGQCLTCVNNQPPVNGNCCDNGFTYQNGGCTPVSNGGSAGNSGNSGSSGSSPNYGACKRINPSLKICIQCLDGRSFDQTGYCS